MAGPENRPESGTEGRCPKHQNGKSKAQRKAHDGNSDHPGEASRSTKARSTRRKRIWTRRNKRNRPTPVGHNWTPPCCPNQACPAHTKPEGQWFLRKGSHWPLCRSRPVQRFRCKRCQRWFSLSSFRADRYDKKPWHNARVMAELCSGTGLRETARMLRMSRTTLQMKARKLSRHCQHTHRNLLKDARLGPRFMLDEGITFEGDRRLRPLSLAVLIEFGSWLIVDAFAAPRAPHGNRSEKTKKRIEEMEAEEGPRKDRHKTAVAKVLRSMAWNLKDRQPRFIILTTDEAPTYNGVFQRVCRALPKTQCNHDQVKSNLAPRDFRNPLFRINQTLALLRDRIGRLRRRSWLHSKRRKWLNLMIQLFICHRNYVRPKKNDGPFTPGEMLEHPEGRMTHEQLLTWRQDWGRERSVAPSFRLS